MENINAFMLFIHLYMVSGVSVENSKPCMKLYQTKVSFSIRPAVFLAGGWADT
jgi:hypothetical protein